MKTVYIDLRKGLLVEDFIACISTLDGLFEIVRDRVTLDAKSILGVYSLDLSQPLLLRMENDSEMNDGILQPFILK